MLRHRPIGFCCVSKGSLGVPVEVTEILATLSDLFGILLVASLTSPLETLAVDGDCTFGGYHSLGMRLPQL